MHYLTTGSVHESWSRLALRDFFIFVRFFLARWLILLGAWNSLVVPATHAPEMSPLTAAGFVVGWIFGFILAGDD